jgi:predicted O-linked N-acetylglucosamine transferase (SPINDLY family)
MASLSQALETALAHHQAGRLELAEEIYCRILAVEPEHAETLHLMGAIAVDRGDFPRAVEYVEHAIRVDGAQAHYHNTLGEAYRRLQKIPEAMGCYQRAIELRPDEGETYNNLGYAWEGLGQLDKALACYQQALRVQPDLAEAHSNLGNAYMDQGDVDEALACYRCAVRLKPGLEIAHRNYLDALRCHSTVTAEGLCRACAEYGRRYAAPLLAAGQHHPNARDPDRVLRLGFVCSGFVLGPIGSFLIHGFENIDRQPFHVTCYSLTAKRDRMTARFEQASHAWRSGPLAPGPLAEQIRADGIDILFDLSGHGPASGLLAFARKPAPIQITWIDSVGTTGLSAMDYLLADRWLIPPALERYYIERILRMPDGYVCYEPPDDAPPVGPLPAAERGSVTFGSFNRPAKIQPEVVRLWARILARLPDSRLVLKHQGFGSAAGSGRYAAMFAAAGIDPARVELQPASSRVRYFEQFNRVDITLEPFPHSGGVTTCDSLWMGVPPVTCPGETFASRQPLSHLSNVGLTETIAQDLEDYVEIAVRLASDLPRLASIRAGLRERVARSPLCDGGRFAANLGVVLRGVWRQWCSSAASS